jgi:tetratricopeptide (TPR) repeat protein
MNSLQTFTLVLSILTTATAGCTENRPTKSPQSVTPPAVADDSNREISAAIDKYTTLIETGADPDGVRHAQRGALWHSAGDYARAKKDFDSAIGILPSECTRHMDYAWLLATCPDDEYRNGGKAVEHAIVHFEIAHLQSNGSNTDRRLIRNDNIRQAIAENELCGEMDIFFKGWNWESLETLAAAFAENGEFERAAKWQAKVIEMFTDDGLPWGHLTENDTEQMAARLKLYQNQQKLRVDRRKYR